MSILFETMCSFCIAVIRMPVKPTETNLSRHCRDHEEPVPWDVPDLVQSIAGILQPSVWASCIIWSAKRWSPVSGYPEFSPATLAPDHSREGFDAHPSDPAADPRWTPWQCRKIRPCRSSSTRLGYVGLLMEGWDVGLGRGHRDIP